MFKKIYLRIFITLISFFNCQANTLDDIARLNNAEKAILIRTLDEIVESLNARSYENERNWQYKLDNKLQSWHQELKYTDNKILLIISNVITSAISEAEVTLENSPVRTLDFYNRSLKMILSNSILATIDYIQLLPNAKDINAK
ncbi:MAG: hypothetical protein P4L22_01555 [Candidatus Babeliales bacterium]|nr:hypothetical protein [Candidatus Babeliales bacterium]